MKSKKGILGLDTVKAVILSLLTLAVIAIAVFLALYTLSSSTVLGNGSDTYNKSAMLVANITTGTTSFFSYVPTIFVLLAIVVIILVISIVIVAVTRFSPGSSRESL